MEALTKRIVAIVLIAVIGVGIGVTAWILLGAPEEAGYDTPGAPSGTPSNRIIKIGALGDLTDITGEGNYQGAYLAISQINTAGGINIGGDDYFFGIIAENTYEAEPFLDVTKGTLAAEKMMTQHKPDFVIGGFRTEALMTYRETVIADEIIIINTGAATDGFCQSVGSDYDKYKYCFRVMPINSSSLAREIAQFFALALAPAMEAATNQSITKVGIIREDLEWTVPMDYILKGYYLPYGYWGLNNNPWKNFTIVDDVAFPITATSTDFTTYLNRMQLAGAQIVCPIISAQGGIKMMTQYAQLHPKYMIAGIDVMSQLGDDPNDVTGYWNETNGNCNYEILMQSTTRTNKTTKTIAMWDAYVDMWHMDPLYTAVGSHGAVYMLRDAITAAQSIDSDAVITEMEKITKANTFEGAGGNIAFNSYHDLYEGYDPVTEKIYSVTLWVQWQAGGTKSVVTSGGKIYPEWIVDAPIQIPSWGINP
ncbi:MAG: ABC transporter substrate-binding protein [Candidatus Lokiarchaeota archaeon]|nr:ABC transporter substrate-binding protein [Candidatus Lokiarchaeota archaeon]